MSVVADLHHFDEEQDPNPDPHQSKRSDPDPHKNEEADPQHCFQVLLTINLIWTKHF